MKIIPSNLLKSKPPIQLNYYFYVCLLVRENPFCLSVRALDQTNLSFAKKLPTLALHSFMLICVSMGGHWKKSIRLISLINTKHW